MPAIVDIYPLSPIQQGILFHSLFSPESGVYMVQTHCVLHPSPDVPAFEGAWNEVVRRHDIFRTAFEWRELDDAVQVVYEHARISLTQLDWRDQSPAEQRERLQEYLIAERKRDFDFSAPPLVRLTLIQLDDESSQFIWTIHHLLIDTWSEVLLFAEVSAFYNAFRQGKSIHTDPAPSYRDYIKWLQQQDLSESDAFWRQLLQGFQSPTPLGGRRTFQPEGEQSYESQQITLSPETTNALQSLARQHEVTLNTLTQGAWALLLSHYSQESDIVFGFTVSGRPFSLPGAEFIIGPFLNTLPIRVQLGRNVTLPPWLRNLQRRSSDLRQFEYSPLARVMRLSDVQDELPLFESIYVFENAPVNLLQREKELTSSRLAIRDLQTVQKSNYPFCVVITPARQLSFQITYDSSAFIPTAIERMLGHLRNLLDGMIANPMARLFDLPLLSVTERRELLLDWNNTETDFPLHLSLPRLFEAQVEKAPNLPALRFEGAELTYGQLNRRANHLAHYLREQGVGPEERVCILMDRSLEMVVSLLGVLKAGGAYVPLDPQYPRERLRTMVAQAMPKVIVTQGHSAEGLGTSAIRTWCWEKEGELLKQYSDENLGKAVEPENAAYVIYTSGSTGDPKGVVISHGAIGNHMAWMQRELPLSAGDRVLQKTAFSFDASVTEFYAPLLAGGCLVMARPGGQQDGEYLVRCVEQEGITVLQLAIPQLRMLLEEGLQGCMKLKRVYCGGEALEQKLVNAFYRQLPGARLFHFYGPTEATIEATWVECHAEEQTDGTVQIGKGIANTRLYVLDKDGQLLPVGVAGELYIGGAGVAQGYLNRPDLTAERFLPDKYGVKGGERVYRTGDLASWSEDGTLQFLGRNDDQVKIRGYRIELGEIEARLRQHEGVVEAAVVVRERRSGEEQLVAYYTTKRGLQGEKNGDHGEEDVGAEQLRADMMRKLPDYMVPAAYVRLNRIPLTVNGKLDRKALPEPEADAYTLRMYEAPRGEVERVLAAIWTEVLKLEQVGRQDNFFELGGHSLLAMRLVSRLRKSFKIDLPLRTILAAATLAEMARAVFTALRQDEALEMSPISRRSRDRQVPLSFAQQRLWLIQHLEPESTAYNVCDAVRLRGHLNVEVLKKTLNEIVRRHEILRTTFTFSGDQLVQVIAPPTSLNLEVEDLRTLSVEEQEAAAQRVAAQEAQVVFNLQSGPLFRVRLLRLDNEHVLTICRHHIIFDAWSIELFTHEFVALYDAFESGQASPLPELPVQYADFACWERDWLRDEKMKTLLHYWKRQLEGAPAVLNLPLDRPPSPHSSYQSKWQSFILDENQTKTIRALSQAERVTVYMVLVAAFKTFLYRYSGQADFLIGTPVTSRNQAEAELLIGCFLNMLVLRTDLSGNPTFRELLGRVRDTVLGAYTHQEMPFDRLVEELKIGRVQTNTPLVQVVFSHVKPLGAAPKPTGLQVTPLEIDEQTGKVDWLMLMVEQGEKIICSLQYRVVLFDDKTIGRAMGHFENLFHSVLQNPDARLDELEMLSHEEQLVLNREIDVGSLSRSFSF